MTILAGIFARHPDTVIPETAVESIRRLICRTPGHAPREFRAPTLFASIVDMHCFDASGVVELPDSLTAVVGDPVVKSNGVRRFANRHEDAAFLGEGLEHGRIAVVGQANGTFAGFHFDRTEDVLILFTDKIGVRQLFVGVSAEFVAFATSLRILENLAIVPKRLDVAALTEQTALHWPLERRTPYLDISVMASAEYCVLRSGRIEYKTYWKWPQDNAGTVDARERLEACHESFLSAIRARLGTQRNASALLSGGLDSRCLVAGLRELGADVSAMNFAPPGIQDQVFAEQFAAKIGARYTQVPAQQLEQAPNVMIAIGNFLAQEERRSDGARPGRLIWTGAGGSVGLGHVYMTKAIVEHLRAGRIDEAITEYMRSQHQQVTRRPLKADVYMRYRDWPRQALKDSLLKITADDPGRAFFLFLMHNDQHQSLQNAVYEHIDLHGIELVLPFFDTDFLSDVYSIPIDDCLYHRFYNQWLDSFNDAVSTTAWQSYPGHIPCPIETPAGLGSQFSDDSASSWSRHRLDERIKRGRTMLGSPRFPSELLSKPTIRAATWLARFGSDRLGYAIDTGYQFFQYAQRASAPIRLNEQER